MIEVLPKAKRQNTGDQKVDGLAPGLFNEWQTLNFTDCMEQNPGIKRKLKKTAIKDNGNIPVIDQGEAFIAGYTDNVENIYNCSLPLIIFGDHTRHIKYVDFEFAVGADGTKIIIPKKFYDIRFFYHYLNALNWQHCGYGRHFKYLKQLDVPLPPLNEQKRITAKLDKIIPGIEATKERLERIPAIIKRFRQSVLTAAVKGKFTEKWREEHPDVESAEDIVEKIKQNRLDKCSSSAQKNKIDQIYNTNEENDSTHLPYKWKYTFLNKICESFLYGTSSKSQKKGKVPVLRMGNLQNGKLDWRDLVYTSDKHEIEKYKLQSGDVLFNRTNSPELVGKTSICLGEHPAIYAGYLIKINNYKKLDSHYLNYSLNSEYARSYCNKVKSDGVNQSNINAQKLGKFEIPLPPLEEQKEIVRQVDKLFSFADKLESHYKKAKEKIDKLPQSVLAKAFRGELVPQDTNDEPAEKRLQRIKEEKTKMETELKNAKNNVGRRRKR